MDTLAQPEYLPSTSTTCPYIVQSRFDVRVGDFWHARGSLPVEPLNAVLRVLRTWTRPTLMLVGNHDQVRLLWPAERGSTAC